MTFHPDPDTLLAFRQHRLAGSRVVAIARHLEECDACGEGSPAEAASLLRAIALPDAGDHLTDEQIDAILDGEVDLTEYQSVFQHLSECAMCRAELDDLREFEGQQQ